MGLGRKVTGGKQGTGRAGRGLSRGTIRAPKRSGNRTGGAKQGTGFGSSKLRKGTIRTTNRYS